MRHQSGFIYYNNYQEQGTRSRNKYIYPGRIFYDNDTNGNASTPAEAVFRITIKPGETYLPEANADWGGTRVDFVG